MYFIYLIYWYKFWILEDTFKYVKQQATDQDICNYFLFYLFL